MLCSTKQALWSLISWVCAENFISYPPFFPCQAKQLGAPQLVTDVARLNQPALAFFGQQGFLARGEEGGKLGGGFGGGAPAPTSSTGRGNKDRGRTKEEGTSLSVELTLELADAEVSSVLVSSPRQGAGYSGAPSTHAADGSRVRTSAVCAKPLCVQQGHRVARLPQRSKLSRTPRLTVPRAPVVRRVLSFV